MLRREADSHGRTLYGTDEARCQEILDGWYREQIRAAAPALIAKWEPVMGVTVGRVFV